MLFRKKRVLDTRSQEEVRKENSLGEILKVARLAAQFQLACEGILKRDAGLCNKMQSIITPEDARLASELCGQRNAAQTIRFEGGGYPSNGIMGLPPIHVLDLKLAELLIKWAAQVLPQERLIGIIPEGLATDRNIQILKENGTEQISALCAHKLSLEVN